MKIEEEKMENNENEVLNDKQEVISENDENITQEDIDNLEYIDFSDNIIIFYAIPCVIYCLERFVKSLMTK